MTFKNRRHSPSLARPFGRREFLLSAGAGLSLAAIPHGIAAPGDKHAGSGEAGRLDRLLARLFDEQMREDPQTMTSLGLDKGSGEWAKSRLTDRSRARVERMIRVRRRWLAELDRIDASKLTSLLAAKNHAVVKYEIALALSRAMSRSAMGRDAFPSPYRLSQITGAYQSGARFFSIHSTG